MNKTFEHYLLTCFNVNRGIDRENKRNSLEYLENRPSLFENITVPSVKNQSCSDFYWFVFFDINTPNKFKNKINDLAKLANFTPHYIESFKNTAEIIKQQLKPKTEYLVTTNLDNDDAIAEDFVKIIQDNLKQEKLYFINLLLGYTISEQGLFMREYYSSPFHTLAQKLDQEVMTCIDVPHHFLRQLHKKNISVYNVAYKPVWLQVVHDSNLRNKIETNAVPIFNLEYLNQFNVKNFPFDYKDFLGNYTNQFPSILKILKKKKNKPLGFRLKLALYALFPKLSIIYNKYKHNKTIAQKEFKSNSSVKELKKLIVDIRQQKQLS